jgi:hypothetical protein
MIRFPNKRLLSYGLWKAAFTRNLPKRAFKFCIRYLLPAVLLGLMAAKLSFYFSAASGAMGTPESVTAEIVALGKPGTASSSGKEVWFYGVRDLSSGSRVEPTILSQEQGWEKRGNTYVSYDSQPSSLKLAVEKARFPAIEFGCHEFSGQAQVITRNSSQVVNLHCLSGQKTIYIDIFSRDQKSWFIALAMVIGLFLFPIRTLIGPSLFDLAASTSILCLGMRFVFLGFYPGVFTGDTGGQLRQAIEERYNDWHPPMMSYLWGKLITFFNGYYPSIFYLTIIITFLSFLAWSVLMARLRVSLCCYPICALPLFPFVANYIGVISKDVLFTFSIALAFGLVGHASLSIRRSGFACRAWQAFVIFTLLSFSIAMRHNAIVAALPALFMWPMIGCSRQNYAFPNKNIGNRIFIIVTALTWAIAMLLVNSLIESLVIKSQDSPAFSYIQNSDLISISVRKNSDYTLESLRVPSIYESSKMLSLAKEELRSRGNLNRILLNGRETLIRVPADSKEKKDLAHRWISTIIRYPLEYLGARIEAINFLLFNSYYNYELPQSAESIAESFAVNFDGETRPPSVYQLTSEAAAKSRLLFYEIIRLPDSFLSVLYDGWLWAAVPVALAIYSFLRRGERSVTVQLLRGLSISSLLYLLPYFFVLPSPDLRYIYWPTLASALGCILILADVSIQANSGKLLTQASRQSGDSRRL